MWPSSIVTNGLSSIDVGVMSVFAASVFTPITLLANHSKRNGASPTTSSAPPALIVLEVECALQRHPSSRSTVDFTRDIASIIRREEDVHSRLLDRLRGPFEDCV